MFESIGVMLLLVLCSFFDIKWKKIPLWAFLAGGVWALASVVISCVVQGSVMQVIGGTLAATLPGIIFLILSFLTEKKVGYGDGILLIILGVLEGLKNVSFICCIGLFLQSLVAVVLVMLRKADKQTCIPFIPFLLTAKIILVFF